MNVGMVLAIGKDTIWTLLMIAAPMLLIGAGIGVFISMVQTVTQLKDQSLTFIPKIVGVMSITIVTTPFIVKTIVSFTQRMLLLAEKLGQGAL